jgi:hypothetical protein
VVRFASIATKLGEHTKALNDSCAPNAVEFLGVGTVYVGALLILAPCARSGTCIAIVRICSCIHLHSRQARRQLYITVRTTALPKEVD